MPRRLIRNLRGSLRLYPKAVELNRFFALVGVDDIDIYRADRETEVCDRLYIITSPACISSAT